MKNTNIAMFFVSLLVYAFGVYLSVKWFDTKLVCVILVFITANNLENASKGNRNQ